MTGRMHQSSWKTLAGLLLGMIMAAWLIFTGAEIRLADGREALIAAIWHHIGYGAVLTPLFCFYLIWRVFDYRRAPTKAALESALFWFMIFILTFLLLSGPVVVWTYGFPVRVFGWFEIPNPIGKLPALHDPLEQAHVIAGYAAAVVMIADFLAVVRRRVSR